MKTKSWPKRKKRTKVRWLTQPTTITDPKTEGSGRKPDLFVSAHGIESLAQRRRAYTALCLAMAMATIDGSIANTALPTIGRELHVGPAATVWVINAFQLAVTATLFAAAGFGASIGLTRVYQAGMVVFTIGSLCCALSGSFALLVAARVLQGVGSAMIMAISPALVRAVFPPAQLVRAFGWNATVVAAAGAAGPTAGGLLLAVAPWPWLFAVNVPFALLALVLGHRTLPRTPATGTRLDRASIASSAVGFALLVYGFGGFSRRETLPSVLLQMGAGAAIFGWFVRRQFRIPHPIVALDLFRLPIFAGAAATSFLSWAAWGTSFVTLPFAFQLDRGVSPLVSGLLMTAWPIGTALSAPIAARAADRISGGIVASAGLGVFSLALGAYAAFEHGAPFVALLGFGAVAGMGFGCFQAPNNGQLLGSVPSAKSGSAGALLATLRVAGQTLGASVVAIVFAGAERASVTGFAHIAVPIAFSIAAALAVIATIVSATRASTPPVHARV